MLAGPASGTRAHRAHLPGGGCEPYVSDGWTSGGRSRHAGRESRADVHRRAPLSQYTLKLYVTGKSPKAEVAIANLRRICDEELSGRYELEIIDVLEHPQRAEDDRILATPTLIKRLPPPLRRVIGDLSDTHRVLLGLELRPDAVSPAAKAEPS